MPKVPKKQTTAPLEVEKGSWRKRLAVLGAALSVVASLMCVSDYLDTKMDVTPAEPTGVDSFAAPFTITNLSRFTMTGVSVECAINHAYYDGNVRFSFMYGSRYMAPVSMVPGEHHGVLCRTMMATGEHHLLNADVAIEGVYTTWMLPWYKHPFTERFSVIPKSDGSVKWVPYTAELSSTLP